MDIKKIIPLVLPSSNSISKLIFNILLLEAKLKNPDQQSEYFRWGIQSQIDRLSAMKKEYRCVRSEYNNMATDELLLVRTGKEQFLREVVPNIHPIFARIIMDASTRSSIWKLNNYLQMKSLTEELPTLDKLKRDPELLVRILYLAYSNKNIS